MNYPAIDKFLKRYNTTVQQGGKEINLTISQAAELVSVINELLLKSLKNYDNMQATSKTSTLSGSGSIIIDGGRIKD